MDYAPRMITRRDFLKLLGVTVVASTVNPTSMIDAIPVNPNISLGVAKPLKSSTVSHKSGGWTGTLHRTRDVHTFYSDGELGDAYKTYYVEAPWEQNASLDLTVDNPALVQSIEDAYYKGDRVQLDCGECNEFTVTGIISKFSLDTFSEGSTTIHVALVQAESIING